MTRVAKLVLVMAALAVPVSGCIRRAPKQTTNVTTTTVGQELADLETAYKNGLLTEKEYNKKRAEILKKK